jgi:hypothetical protein
MAIFESYHLTSAANSTTQLGMARSYPVGDEFFDRLLALMTELPSVKDHWSADGQCLGNYTIDEFLGAGAFGQVFSCTAHNTARPTRDGGKGAAKQLAVKHVNKAKLHVCSDVGRTLRRTRQLCQELAAMSLIGADCEFVCALVEVLHTKHHVHLVMEVRAGP